MRAPRSRWPLAALGGVCLIYGAFAAPQAPSQVDFQHDVLPIFRAHCMPCHTAKDKAAGLDLTQFSGLGKNVIAGQASKSEMMIRILGQGGKPRMPMGFKPLSPEDTKTIRDWIDQGAKKVASTGPKKHWAFVAPVRPKPPVPKTAGWVRNPIDAFILSRIEREGLKPSVEADRVTLLRRVTLDLTGLPPTPAEVDAFIADKSPTAYEKAVDRLLASPHYGERMALPWLDAARYADSNGFQQDGDTFQYVWRDWVVRALNENMPFDRFTIEQLAGDLLPEPSLGQLIATGFNRNHMLNGEGGAIPEEQRNVVLFDRVDTTATAWLGLTMACARCHDHKYDPLSQRDFYSFMAYFNQVPESGVPSGGGQYRIADPWVYVGDPFQMMEFDALRKSFEASREAAKRYEAGPESEAARRVWEPKGAEELAKSTDANDLAILKIIQTPEPERSADVARRLHEFYLERGLEEPGKGHRRAWKRWEEGLNRLRSRMPRVMIMSDRQPRKTYVYNRGNYEEPLDEVRPAVPASLPKMETKNRLDLAKWIVDKRNPLTTRVQVNRAWQLFFGRGLVRTEENFGIKGEPPTHPELLDWLAVDFRESGWNMKRLNKMIVMSATYRQTSKMSAAHKAKDPANVWYARSSRFRMPSMLLRDMALASSGLLNPQIGGKPVYPYQPKGIWDGLSITLERDFTYPQSKGDENHRRSLYTFWRRTVAPGNMFDASSRQVCTVKPSLTSTPLHALTMLNDVTWVEAGRGLAVQVMPLVGDEARLKEAFRRVCGRRPNANELKVLSRSLQRSRQAFTADPEAARKFLTQGDSPLPEKVDVVELAALASVCLAIYNLDEAMTRE